MPSVVVQHLEPLEFERFLRLTYAHDLAQLRAAEAIRDAYESREAWYRELRQKYPVLPARVTQIQWNEDTGDIAVSGEVT